MKPSKQIDPQQVSAHFDRYFQKVQIKSHAQPTQVKVFSEKLGLDYDFSSNSTSLEGPAPYHVASIGKMFTAVLVQMLAERGTYTIKDPIARFFSPAELERLFVYKGVDYAGQVTIEHLLGHTSGIADYFEGKVTRGETLIKDVLANPHTRWTPDSLIEFTRERQQAVGAPGKVFNYSDTGYLLLGKLIEKVSGKPFHHNLQESIFRPLEMCDTYLMFFGEPANPKRKIEKIWFGKQEVSQYESLSCDWAGGGIVSTTADLLKFNRALRGGQLIQSGVLETMDVCAHKFQPGIYYGLGMMEIRFRDFFFLLGRLPQVKGHIGILSTHLFYDPTTDAHVILNFGATTRMAESFRALIEIETMLQRMNAAR